MITIEPCCANKHWKQVLKELEMKKTVLVNGYGDMTLTELLPEVLQRYSEADVLMALPTVPEQMRTLVGRMLRRTWALAQGGNVDVVRRLRLITDARASKSPGLVEWAQGQERLRLANAQHNDTLIIVHNGNPQGECALAIMGPVNMVPCGQWTAMVTRDPVLLAELRAEMVVRFEAFML